jgi:hypothetical protein
MIFYLPPGGNYAVSAYDTGFFDFRKGGIEFFIADIPESGVRHEFSF